MQFFIANVLTSISQNLTGPEIKLIQISLWGAWLTPSHHFRWSVCWSHHVGSAQKASSWNGGTFPMVRPKTMAVRSTEEEMLLLNVGTVWWHHCPVLLELPTTLGTKSETMVTSHRRKASWPCTLPFSPPTEISVDSLFPVLQTNT